MQLSRNSDAEKHNSVRSGTEKSVPTLSKRLESPTLTHQPLDEANELLKSRSSSEHEPKKSVSALSVPCQSNLCELWYVGSSAPEQERRSISPPCSFWGGAKELNGLRHGAGASKKSPTPRQRAAWCIRKKADWARRSLEQKYSLFMDECRSNSHKKVCVFRHSVRCVGQPHPHATQIWKGDRIGYFVETSSCCELQDMAGKPVWNS